MYRRLPTSAKQQRPTSLPTPPKSAREEERRYSQQLGSKSPTTVGYSEVQTCSPNRSVFSPAQNQPLQPRLRAFKPLPSSPRRQKARDKAISAALKMLSKLKLSKRERPQSPRAARNENVPPSGSTLTPTSQNTTPTSLRSYPYSDPALRSDPFSSPPPTRPLMTPTKLLPSPLLTGDENAEMSMFGEESAELDLQTGKRFAEGSLILSDPEPYTSP
ncbi:hypothetical protein FRB99_008395 [Tulasnella sp. 403]|nr:hypothetical protein FRB99_008395 [Tulasnella sp. 403]